MINLWNIDAYTWYIEDNLTVDVLRYMKSVKRKSVYLKFYNKHEKRIIPLYQ